MRAERLMTKHEADLFKEDNSPVGCFMSQSQKILLLLKSPRIAGPKWHFSLTLCFTQQTWPSNSCFPNQIHSQPKKGSEDTENESLDNVPKIHWEEPCGQRASAQGEHLTLACVQPALLLASTHGNRGLLSLMSSSRTIQLSSAPSRCAAHLAELLSEY